MDIIVPKVGLTVEELEVTAWHKEPGDRVAAGEVVCEVAADKADLEIEAPVAGVLAEIRFAVGATAAPGDVLAVVAVEGESAAPRAVEAEIAAAPPVASSTNGAGEGRVRISPVARRAAERHGIAPGALTGSGPQGRIVLRDVEAAASPAEPDPLPLPLPPAPPAQDDLVEVRWTAARRATRRLMAESAATVAPVTLHRRAGADAAMAAVKRMKAQGLPATFTHAILAATARALPAHPALNALWSGDRLLRARRVHLGLAVDDGGDLLLGTVADAADRDLTGLVLGAVEAVARARQRETPSVAATFSISNLGMLGIEQFTPIITPPQVAVLGVGAVVDGRCHLSLTFDHRAVDGAPAARFLAEVVGHLQSFDGR